MRDRVPPEGPASAPSCAVCGGNQYDFRPVLWDSLVGAWELSGHERAWIDRQQGQRCLGCRCNLRSIALARALVAATGRTGTLQDVADRPPADRRILEVNGAGHLTPWLRRFPGWEGADHPEIDLCRLPHPDRTFDLVIHSDSLEHVPDALRSLLECRRVLRDDGCLVFTVPAVPGRLSRSRAGLPPAFHGNSATARFDFLVHWEFGADLWMWPLLAGFDRVEAWPFAFPAAVAWIARSGPGR